VPAEQAAVADAAALDKIASILKAGFGSTAFPVY
jgi:hypothetical protein